MDNTTVGGNIAASGKLTFITGNSGLPKLRIETRFSVAEIYLLGAQVTHFEKPGQPPLLFLSAQSLFAGGSPIRGGIPIVFPWFGPKPGLASHGYARIATWEVKEVSSLENGAMRVRLRLPEKTGGENSLPLAIDYLVTVGETLELELLVTNQSADRVIEFEECLHTYFSVGDINSVTVTGLQGIRYLDKVGGSVEKLETDPAIKIDSEVDRVYQDTPHTVEIRDEKLRRKITISKHGSNSTVVWNPWIAKSKALADFGDEEYLQMLCIESGNVGKNKKTLQPNESSSLKAQIASAAL